jgi:3-hydroxyisobutyrate dehydrogenase
MPERLTQQDVIGFVGLGRMGTPMTGRLRAAGYTVLGYDIRPQARKELGDGAVGNLRDVAQGAAAVILMLPDSGVVRQVTEADGLLDAMTPGTLLIDMSSSEPAGTTELAAAASRRGIRVVGAPVSGGVSGARAGTLTIMAGGDSGDVERARPVLEAIGGRVLHVGPGSGAGHALKALNNLLSGITMLATSEAMLAGQRFGLDPQVMLDALNTSSGRSGSTENKWPNYVLTGTYDAGFTLRLLIKDMNIALGVGRQSGARMPLGETATSLWERAGRSLPPDADHTEIVKWLNIKA